jgi:hypothetical protein
MDLLSMLPAYLFHAVSTALGAFLIARSLSPRSAPKVPQAA